MNCSECRKKMSDQMDQTLTLHEQRLMNRHLDGCAACREELESLQEARALLQGIQDVPLPAEFDRRMKHALFQQNLKHTIGPNVVKASTIARQTAGGRSWTAREKSKNRWKAVTSLVAVCAVGIGIIALSNDLLAPATTTPEQPQTMLMTTMDQEGTSAPAMTKMAVPEAAQPAQTRSVEPAAAEQPVSTKSAATKPQVQYIDYAYLIEQKLNGYQYEVVTFDNNTGTAKLLITTDQTGTLINRELEIQCQDGRIRIIDNWLGL